MPGRAKAVGMDSHGPREAGQEGNQAKPGGLPGERLKGNYKKTNLAWNPTKLGKDSHINQRRLGANMIGSSSSSNQLDNNQQTHTQSNNMKTSTGCNQTLTSNPTNNPTTWASNCSLNRSNRANNHVSS